jgi:hypothetical protein
MYLILAQKILSVMLLLYIYKYAIVVVGKLYIHIGNHWINIGRSKFYVRCFGLKKKNQILHVL